MNIGIENALLNLNAMQPRFDRGYTGHEHMCGFGLINMNGRLYDPYLQRFLSPDPYVQAPVNAQNFNRYSYVLNNPFMYTDPDGEWLWLVFAIYGAWTTGVRAGIAAERAGGHFWKDGFWKGAIAGAIVGAGSFISGGAAVHALNVGGIFPGALVGGLTGTVVGGLGGGLSSWAMGGNFWDGAKQGALIGGISGAFGGGFAGFKIADAKGKNLWWGTDIGYNRNKWSFFNWDIPDYTIDFQIPNVGSKLPNDCVPTTFAEVETRRGDPRTYNEFKKISNYQENVGVSISGTDYDQLLNNTFNNVQTLQRTDYHRLFNSQYMQNAANKNHVISFHFKGHADNVRALKVFTNAPHKNKLIFRQSRYNLTPSGGRYSVLNIFIFF